ncbi:RICIN domain-containing protein [Microbispora sp. H10830]|uniref:RICIN domain-containing protein n=1 Tax=Microbispora sp. H10830 TaxID=2729109 RepID=UPI00160277CA|nr:RICIN domain-containing protein [Microbispora sp. H10830]
MKRSLAVTTVVSAAFVGLTAWPSQAATPVANGVYTLASGSSGKCVTVDGAGTANGTVLTQLACDSAADEQQFRVVSQNGAYGLVNVNSGKCVDVPNYSSDSGVQLWQWTCGASTNQTWTLTPSSTADRYLLKSNFNGLCVSNKDGSTSGGNPIVQEPCSDIARMQWRFNPTAGTPTPTTTPTSGPSVPYSSAPDGFAGTSGMGLSSTTGGAGGQTVTVTTLADLIKYAGSSSPYIIRVNAPITVTPYGTEIKVASNKTIVGVGKNGQIVNGGFNLNNVSNVIIRNLQIRDTRMADDDPDDKLYDFDGVQMDTSHHVWLDHNYIVRMNDGLIDSRKDTSYLTVSWNVIGEGHKAFGIGWTPNVTARITIHHNWIHDNDVRNPSTDNVAYAHLYNNYMQNITGYGNYSRGKTKMVIENTYYDHVNSPYYRDDTAELKQTGSICVSCSGQKETGGSAFTPSSFYSYRLDPAANVPSLVKTYAGPQASIGL